MGINNNQKHLHSFTHTHTMNYISSLFKCSYCGESREKEKEKEQEKEKEKEKEQEKEHNNDDYLNQLIKWEDTTPFAVPISGGQVIKVYDGDTITIAAKLHMKDSPLYRFSVRMYGIDTPEIKGHTEDERAVAKEARDTLAALVMHKYVTLKNVTTEKYGRILADVYLGNLHINNWLIEQRLAVKYDGGTKISPESWVRYRLVGEGNPVGEPRFPYDPSSSI